jgi:carboxypeptidase C (cathepsin A)
MLTQHLDVLLCHQILNPLNYLYLDAAFLGYPVLHNAPMCKDLGYYYEGSDTIDAAKQLDYILTEHDKNIDAYDERNDKVLQRYHADNMDIVKTYDKLIENLFNGGNHGLVYNPNTNLYDNL